MSTSNLSLFMKANKTKKENVKFAATKSLCDKDGNALEWEVRPLSTKEDEANRTDCTKEVQVTGKPNLFRPKFDSNLYMTKMMVSSIVFPDLFDAALQNDYGVMTPEDLLKEMIDDPGEYQDFVVFVQKFNGFNVTMADKVEDAKN